MKRVFDLLFSGAVLLVAWPVVAAALLLVWLQDFHSPIYKARRVGKGDRDFLMVKVRSMVANADRTGVNSTGGHDNRITPVGRYIRKLKLDEVSQFWNVLKGDMSVVGPRPQVRAQGVDLYTDEEMRLLSVRPGVTDLSSIIFSDESDILEGAEDADALYNQIIRPWKSRLGLLYIDRRSLWLDLRIIWLTGLAITSKPAANAGVHKILTELGADPRLIEVCQRAGKPPAADPPGRLVGATAAPGLQ